MSFYEVKIKAQNSSCCIKRLYLYG